MCGIQPMNVSVVVKACRAIALLKNNTICTKLVLSSEHSCINSSIKLCSTCPSSTWRTCKWYVGDDVPNDSLFPLKMNGFYKNLFILQNLYPTFLMVHSLKPHMTVITKPKYSNKTKLKYTYNAIKWTYIKTAI